MTKLLRLEMFEDKGQPDVVNQKTYNPMTKLLRLEMFEDKG